MSRLARSALSVVAACAACAACAAGAAQGAQVLGVQATRDGSHFEVGMRVVLDAPAMATFAALRDYPVMPRYDPEIRAVRVEPTADPARVRLFMTIHTCVLLFCKTVHQEQLMTSMPDPRGGELRADFIGAPGAFQGHGSWRVHACSARPAPACMMVRIELEPRFWVPPVIGPWLVGRKMAEEARRISAGVEQLARHAR